MQKILNENDFKSTISESNEITIRPKKNNQTEGASNDSCFQNVEKYIFYKPNQIEGFKKLFENAEYTGYCCCPQTNYSINFYKGSEKISTYFLDTVEFKNKIRIFQSSYQFSYIIENDVWEKYLENIKNGK